MPSQLMMLIISRLQPMVLLAILERITSLLILSHHISVLLSCHCTTPCITALEPLASVEPFLDTESRGCRSRTYTVHIKNVLTFYVTITLSGVPTNYGIAFTKFGTTEFSL